MLGAIGRMGLGAGIGGTIGAMRSERDSNGQNYNVLRGAASGMAVGGVLGLSAGGFMRMHSSSYAKGFNSGSSRSANQMIDAIKDNMKQPTSVMSSGAQFAETLSKGGVRGAAAMGMQGLGYMAGVAPGAMAMPFAASFRGINALQAMRRGVPVPPIETKGAIAGVGARIGGFAMLGAGYLMPTDAPQVRGVKNQRADMAAYRNQQQMGMADAVIMRNPNMAGMRDVDGAYDYMSHNRSSSEPLTGVQAERHQQTMRRSQRRMQPGMYGDGGDLVFAMNDLRKNY